MAKPAQVATDRRPAASQDETFRHNSSRLRLPLILDLDGSLLSTDLLFECFAAALKRNPLVLILAFWWLLQGRAVLKHKLAAWVSFDIDTLPINEDLAAYAAEEAARGRKVLIATAANELLARRVALRFPFISGVIASDGLVNLKGATKAVRLAEQFPQGFDYAGDSRADLPVWRVAAGIVLVNVSPKTRRAAEQIAAPLVIFERKPRTARTWVKALRLKQWAKNALVVAPVALAGRVLDPVAWGHALLAFLALGLVASATYLLNDLIDLSDDRRHWSKRNRPLASGALPIGLGLVALPSLLFAGLALAAVTGLPTLVGVGLYLVLTLSYSFKLKRMAIVDVATLATLFTLRLMIGIAAIGAIFSPWLFVFSMSLFLSLSIAKRHTELVRMAENGVKSMAGRGYLVRDEPLLLALGMTTACSSIILLSLYLTNEAFRAGFYAAPVFLWAGPGILFLWLGRIWLLSQRGELDDDPVAFALKDRASLCLGASLIAAFITASFGIDLL